MLLKKLKLGMGMLFSGVAVLVFLLLKDYGASLSEWVLIPLALTSVIFIIAGARILFKIFVEKN